MDAMQWKHAVYLYEISMKLMHDTYYVWHVQTCSSNEYQHVVVIWHYMMYIELN